MKACNKVSLKTIGLFSYSKIKRQKFMVSMQSDDQVKLIYDEIDLGYLTALRLHHNHLLINSTVIYRTP